MKKEKQLTKDLWEIIHKSVATDHIVFSTTIVEALDADSALKFFNKNIADNHWIYPAEIKDVRALMCYSTKR